MSFEQPLYLGVDGGGSKCRALLTDANGNTLGHGISGAANLLRGLENSQQAILDAYEQARVQAGIPPGTHLNVIAGMGIAGAHITHLKEALSNWKHPFSELYLTHDLEVACLAAHNGQSGAVIIIGTGSCGLSLQNGEAYSIGGHGFLLGDKGSGAWYGRSAVQCALESVDGLGEETKLLDRIYEFAGVDSDMELVAAFANAAPKKFAELAPMVFEMAESDPVCARLVDEGVAYIARLCEKLMERQPERFSFLGGLSPLVLARLPEELRTKIEPALTIPEKGAILYAQMCQKQKGLAPEN